MSSAVLMLLVSAVLLMCSVSGVQFTFELLLMCSVYGVQFTFELFLVCNLLLNCFWTSPSQIIDDHCHGKNSQYHSLFINAGGEDANIGGKYYDEDNISSNSFYVDPTKRWAYVCSGDFLSTTANSSDYIRNNTCGVSSPEATLYDKARICPQSLTYYGFCLQKGNYTVELDFAEIVFSKDEDYSSLGKRVFDVYIQNTKVIKDFNIKKEAGSPNKKWNLTFTAKVDHNLLEIRLFWAGKGSLYNPPALNGPLISAISVTPVRLLLLSTTIYSDFKIGVLSTKWIVGIVIAVVSALVLASLLLWAFMWRMGWDGWETENTTVKIREKEYSLKEVIVATGNFGPQNEIGQMVYMAKLRDQEKPVAAKKLPLYTKQFDQITNEVCAVDPNVQGQLNWERRVGICRGIAKGLEYLHELATGKIIHRNIKASKVLLDEDFNAKLSDLGLAMLYDEDEPHDFLQKIAAAVTYMAPEVLKKESVTDKADVFSYGIVLLEIISGQSNSKHEGKEERESLLQRAAVLHKKGSYSELVDKKLTSYDMKQFIGIFDLAMRCVDQTRFEGQKCRCCG
ncbi:hypothetical protein Patl1_09748 [Pistacia atlantica]|uniref:Uncharacterized protein n=1 Tax=Pistacia atlantica TaxID=434234 RepID=A0ACC1A2Q8_9ROSI|nr:hypothetical protein Patl1_09748 [Pistacia atlantica]